MWVPRERLFEAFSIVARHDGSDELAPLVWPDGRRLPIEAKRCENDACDVVPFDGSLQEDFCLSFFFPEDEALRQDNEREMESAKRNGHQVWDSRQMDGRYRVECIWTLARLRAHDWHWLDEDEELVRVEFTAATSSISDVFAASSSVQRWFVALAREIGAVSCTLDYEGPFTLLYLNGESLHVRAEELPEPLCLWRHPGSEAARAARLCDGFNAVSSAHERMEIHLLLRSENSGLRAKALKALVRVEREKAFAELATATRDFDPRVRAVAASLFGEHGIKLGVPTLELMLEDAHPEVRIAAARALGELDSSFEKLVELLQLPPIPENLGTIKAALQAIARTPFGSRIVPAMEVSLARPDFPFKQTVTEKIKMFQRFV